MRSNGAVHGDAVHADGGHVPHLPRGARQRPRQPAHSRQPVHDHVALRHPPGAARLPPDAHQLPLCRTRYLMPAFFYYVSRLYYCTMSTVHVSTVVPRSFQGQSVLCFTVCTSAYSCLGYK